MNIRDNTSAGKALRHHIRRKDVRNSWETRNAALWTEYIIAKEKQAPPFPEHRMAELQAKVKEVLGKETQ